MTELIESKLTERIIGAAIEVHKEMGPGLLESVYEECLARELFLRGLNFQRQVQIPLIFKNVHLDSKLIVDLLVEDKVVVEIKSVQSILPIHTAQTKTYLKLSEKRVGLIFNFNTGKLMDGFQRVVN